MTTKHERYALRTIPNSCTEANDFFEHYSAFKHGCHEASDFYANALAVLVTSMLAECADGSNEPLIFTSPPFAAIPSASHYLTERLMTRLQADNPAVSPLSYIPLRKRAAGRRHDYSRLAPADRAASQTVQVELFIDPPPELRRRHIIVVNDLRVTGHQEYVLGEYLTRKLNPRRITWFYLGEVASELARIRPDIENRLNLANLPTADDYVNFLFAATWSPTARGVRRLLDLPGPLIRQVLLSMTPESTVELAELAQAELLRSAREILMLIEHETSST